MGCKAIPLEQGQKKYEAGTSGHKPVAEYRPNAMVSGEEQVPVHFHEVQLLVPQLE